MAPEVQVGMHDALADGAGLISGEQKALIGNDAKLQASTGWKFVDPLKVIIYSGNRTTAYWAWWRELGTHPHSLATGARRKSGKLQDKGPHHPGERAQPFFFPIFRANRKKVVSKISRRVTAAMKKVAKA